MSDQPIVIWGAGAIGGTLGACWRRAGHEVLLVDQEAEHIEAIRDRGLTIRGPIANFSVGADASLPDEVQGKFRQIMLCVKAQHTPTATKALRPYLADDGFVVSVQNGLNEKVIADIVGRSRTIGAFVNFGADYLEPGVIHYGGHGAVVVGELDGKIQARTLALHSLFCDFDQGAVLSDNIWGYLWAKLAYGALLFATALTNDSIADCLELETYRPVMVALAREVVGVAVAVGVTPQGFDGFDPSAFAPGSSDENANKSLDLLVAHNRRSTKTHSGIWRDLSIRKRHTEVDAQLGPVVDSAAKIGQDVPITRCLISLIHDIEDNRRAQGINVLAELTRARD